MLVTPARPGQHPVQHGCLSACASSQSPGSAGPVPARGQRCLLCLHSARPGPGMGLPWSAAGVLCSTRGKQDGDLCPPGAQALTLPGLGVRPARCLLRLEAGAETTA